MKPRLTRARTNVGRVDRHQVSLEDRRDAWTPQPANGHAPDQAVTARLASPAARSKQTGPQGACLTATVDELTLLVVIVIIGILLAIAVLSYLGFKDRANKSAAQANLRSAVPSAEAFCLGREPGSDPNARNKWPEWKRLTSSEGHVAGPLMA